MIRISAMLAVATVSLLGPTATAQTAKPTPAPLASIGITAYAPPPGQGDTSMSNIEAPGFLRRAMPDGDIRDWIAEDDPVMALVTAEGAPQLRSGFVFDVGPDGRVTGCRLDRYSPPNLYTDGLCERMSERMRFRPPLARLGERTADHYFAYVWFDRGGRHGERRVNHQSLPPPPAPMPGQVRPQTATATVETLNLVRDVHPPTGVPAVVRLRLEIEATGVVSQCLVTISSGEDATDIALCRLMLAHRRFNPARDGAGRPRATTLYSWSPPLK